MKSRIPEHRLGGSRCSQCGKGTYSTRRAARKACRVAHPNDPAQNAYRCPFGTGFHYGHHRPWLRDQPAEVHRALIERNPA